MLQVTQGDGEGRLGPLPSCMSPSLQMWELELSDGKTLPKVTFVKAGV